MPMRVSIVVVFGTAPMQGERAEHGERRAQTNVRQSSRSRRRAPAASSGSTRSADASSLTAAMMTARSSPAADRDGRRAIAGAHPGCGSSLLA